MSSKSNSTSSTYKNEIKAEFIDLRPFKCVGDIPIKKIQKRQGGKGETTYRCYVNKPTCMKILSPKKKKNTCMKIITYIYIS